MPRNAVSLVNEAEIFMLYLTRTILPAVCMTVLSAMQVVVAQQKQTILSSNQPVSFSLSPGGGKAFLLRLKEDEIVDITWLANDELILHSGILDPSGKSLAIGDDESLLFIAPRSGEYTLILKFDESSERTDEQTITVEYTIGFTFPKRSKQKAFRKINGYDIRVYASPEIENESGTSIVIFEKAGLTELSIRLFDEPMAGLKIVADHVLPHFERF